MKTFLVTGGAGFIGSNFINYLHNNYEDYIINLDKLSYGSNLNNIEISSDRYKFIRKSIGDDITEIIDNIDYIINFAAESHFNFHGSSDRVLFPINGLHHFSLLMYHSTVNFKASGKSYSGFHPSSFNLSDLIEYLTSCPGLSETYLRFPFFPIRSKIFSTISIFSSSWFEDILYISPYFPLNSKSI